jgi:hypothetical protein
MKPIAEKLRIAPGTTLWISHPQRLGLLGPLPDEVRVVDDLDEAASAVVLGDDAASVRDLLATHAERLGGVQLLWVAYPKGNRSDINRDTLWPILAEHGLRPIAQVALDEMWSALRFRPLKPGEDQFTGGRRP